MNHAHYIAGISIFGLLNGCLAASQGEAEAPQLEGPTESTAAPLIRGSVSGTFPVTQECQPLPFPITAFLSGIFGPDHMVDQTATATSDGRCQHDQVLDAPAEAWARFAYHSLCYGGGDARLCGAQATRLCSVDLLLQWAEERDRAVTTRDPTFGFTYVFPPQNERSRRALQRRALQEIQTLLDETESVRSGLAAGARDCPDENDRKIDAIFGDAMDMYRELSAELDRDG